MLSAVVFLALFAAAFGQGDECEPKEAKKFLINELNVNSFVLKEFRSGTSDRCCGGCQEDAECNVWQYEIATKQCTWMNTYDYTESSDNFLGGKFRKGPSLDATQCVESNDAGEETCAHNDFPICETNQETGEQPYQGDKATTRDGLTCQNWDTDEFNERSLAYKDADNQAKWLLDGGHNKCRVAGWHSPWCYTTDSEVIWDFCFEDCTEKTWEMKK